MSLAGALLTRAAAAPHLGGAGDGAVSFMRVAASLLICLAIAVLAALLLRQRAGAPDLAAVFGRLRARPGRVDVVEMRRISPHADVCLLRHDGREYLILVQAGTSRVLHEGTATEPPCA